MPFKIVRNDITKMRCDAIVNTANTKPIIGSGCDYAVYKAAGKRRLSEYREKNIGESRIHRLIMQRPEENF